eukprot:TRINITY_DN14856_c0_g1_i1.p3 TRINITY_DN14856_c0_g1~~TRINITY_DN14856_c0_g1_i1.p3  ORF type:complete len:137 (+),score=22.02 TRINITY_DN14856_c0_g1_i1:407-817(+)
MKSRNRGKAPESLFARGVCPDQSCKDFQWDEITKTPFGVGTLHKGIRPEGACFGVVKPLEKGFEGLAGQQCFTSSTKINQKLTKVQVQQLLKTKPPPEKGTTPLRGQLLKISSELGYFTKKIDIQYENKDVQFKKS